MCINPINLHHTTVRDFTVISHVRKLRVSEVKRFAKVPQVSLSWHTGWELTLISLHSWIPPLPSHACFHMVFLIDLLIRLLNYIVFSRKIPM